MGLGILKEGVFTTWEIPLIKGQLSDDTVDHWEDNTWIISHLRQLADQIEIENPRIINIGLVTDGVYNSPMLFIQFYTLDK